jgi:adenosine deaminase|tara:strand:- start:265 stop:1320 length:1056 start_codon:yes stop_codon:yes gene_type:complete
MKFTSEIIKKLPKAELHCHLDGSVRVKTIIDLAQRQGVDLPSKNEVELLKILSIGDSSISLEDYIEKFDITLSVLQTPESLEQVAFELAMDCHDDGVRYLEVRYSPILHTKKGMQLSETICSVKKGLAQAFDECGIITGIIICGIRHISPDHSMELANLSIQYKNKGVVGFDLAGAEENFPAKKHKEAFYSILNNNINTTIHAGEAFGPQSIHQALHVCGAHRIGHGTRVYEDVDLLNYINDHRIPLEICLTSNVHTKAVSSISKHPFKHYINEKVRVTLNTDNRLISNTSLSNEYKIAINNFNLNENEIRTIIINGFKSAFLKHSKRRELIRKVVDELECEFNFSKHLII